MFRWYRELSTADRRAFWGAYGGWGLDAMDVQIFSFLIPSLIATLRITRGEIGVLGTSVLISSAIGGWLGGILGDRFGRVRTMQITVIWYSLFTFLCGFATNFDQMLAFRVMQGIGFGGEWAAGAVLIGEIVKPQHRGKTLGCLGSAYATGWGAAALLTSLVLALAPPDIAWRWAFWLGLLPAVLVIFIRRFVTEPEIFEEAKAAQVSGHKVGSMEIFRSTLLRRTLLACLLSIGLQGSVVTILTWLPTFLKTERGLSNSVSGTYIAVVTAGAFFGYIANGYLSDMWSRRYCFITFCVASYVFIILYAYLPMSDVTMLWLGFPLGFVALGNFGSLAPFLTELFPTELRATGQGFSNSIGRAIGGLFVATVGYLSTRFTLIEAIGGMALVGYGLAALAALLLPETRGTVLASLTSASSPSTGRVLGDRIPGGDQALEPAHGIITS